jgi:maleate isomerase
MSLGFGWAARIGQLYPSGGQCDYEPQIMAPAGVQFLTTRMTFRRAALADDIALVNDIETHAGLLADAAVDLIAFNCTAASLVAGPEVINRRIRAATGIRSITTIEGVLAALNAAGIKRPALLTPYVSEVVEHEIAYLAGQDFTVAAAGGIPCTTPVQQGAIKPETWIAEARKLKDADADGLLISCAGIQIAPVLAQIEQEFGRPVVASNQALLWLALRTLGIADRPREFGALLAGRFDGTAVV